MTFHHILNILSGQNGSSASLELDLEHYVVPAPATSALVYAANLTATPRSLNRTKVFSGTDGSTSMSSPSKDGHAPNDRPAAVKVFLLPLFLICDFI